MSKNWNFREAKEDDLPFIYSTWCRSYRYDSPIGRACKNSIFFPNFNKVIDHILGLPDNKVLVACDKTFDHVVFGYMVHQPDIIHYAFTKEAFFKFGIAKSLLEELGGAKYYTHKTMNISPIVKKHQELIFNPFLLYKQGEDN